VGGSFGGRAPLTVAAFHFYPPARAMGRLVCPPTCARMEDCCASPGNGHEPDWSNQEKPLATALRLDPGEADRSSVNWLLLGKRLADLGSFSFWCRFTAGDTWLETA